MRYEGIEMNLEQKIVSRDKIPVKLTPKEFNLLKFMLENTEKVLSRSEIAEKVWETHFDTGTNFIDVYINYLRKKIDKDFAEKLIHTKAGMGFIMKRIMNRIFHKTPKDENKNPAYTTLYPRYGNASWHLQYYSILFFKRSPGKIFLWRIAE